MMEASTMPEVTLAYGARQVRRLIEVLEMDSCGIEERVQAIQLLCDVCSDQEKKSSAVGEFTGDLVMELLNDPVPELVLGSCRLIQSLGKIYAGRKDMKDAGVLTKLVYLIGSTSNEAIKLDAARCVALMTSSPDGVGYFENVEDTIRVLVRYVKDMVKKASVHDGAKATRSMLKEEAPALLEATRALCNLTVRQKFLEEALEEEAHVRQDTIHFSFNRHCTGKYLEGSMHDSSVRFSLLLCVHSSRRRSLLICCCLSSPVSPMNPH